MPARLKRETVVSASEVDLAVRETLRQSDSTFPVKDSAAEGHGNKQEKMQSVSASEAASIGCVSVAGSARGNPT
jgi:hypothetical protein